MCRTCKKFYKQSIAKHVNAYNREYYSQHKEYSRAKAARRRVRVKIDMDDLDRQLSRAYRLAIANDPCHYCKQHKAEMQDDHKLALAAGGTDHWWNLTRACKDCNKKKFDKPYELFVGLVAQEA
jgi:5-methylcytosine-specific restriction endonuclease McrA